MKITLEHFDLAQDRVSQSIEHFVLLEEDYFIYRSVAYFDCHPNKSEGEYKVEKDQFVDYEGLFLRSAIVGLEKGFINSDEGYEYYFIEPQMNGTFDRVRFKFQTEAKANEFLEIFKKYVLRKPYK